MNFKTIKYNRKNQPDFHKTLKQRVDEYFKSNNISKYGNSAMKIKTVAMIALYLIPYFLLVFGVASNMWLFFGLWLWMGVGMAGIGLSVMHDANHGSYSPNKKVNNALGKIICLVGGYPINWKIQHNVLHHTYTNIDGLDEDIESASFLRFSPNQEKKKIHRYQYIYAWFFYGLMTLLWATTKDFKQIFRYNKMGLLKGQRTTLKKELTGLITYKLLYFVYTLVIPLIFLSVPWYLIVAGFLAMHFTAGLILALIFQTAHVMESSEYPVPDKETNSVKSHWAVHQLLNTTNFAPKNKLLTWYVGGLNFQVEHHLFPNICHIHYPKISKIVEEVTKEFELPYYVEPTFVKAVGSHTRMLKQLGK